MKNIIIKSYILLLILITSSTLVAQLNTLRENDLIFSSGVQFNDTIHEALGSTVPNDVCNQAVTSEKCTQTYGTYWQAFAENGATISTLNATLVRDQGLEEDFKVIVSGVQGIEQGDVKSDASGFNTAPFVDDGPLEYSVDGGSDQELTKDRGSFTYLQAGISVFGPSIWVRNDVDSNKASINAYRAVDWALNPAGPEPLGFNVFSPDATASEPVLIGDWFEVNPGQKAVRIHQENSDECNDFSNGLCIEGNASVQSVIGKIGLIRSSVRQDYKDYKDFNLDSGGSETDNLAGIGDTSLAFLFNGIPLDTKGNIQTTSAVDYMVAYIGFISITGMDEEDSLQYFMQVGANDESDCKKDYSNKTNVMDLGGGWDPNANGGAGAVYPYTSGVFLNSTKGEFDYQGGANSEASFQFVVIENIKGYNDSSQIKRSISICWAWSATAEGDNHVGSQFVDVRAGYLIYGLPTGQAY